MAENRIAFVTGSGRGIGRAIAQKLSTKGMNVVVADLNIDNAIETVKQIKESGGEAIAVDCDVTNFSEVAQAVETVISHYGRIDVLVNNAGGGKINPFLQTEPEAWDREIRINLLGPIHTCKVILPIMIENSYGKVVNIASDSGRVGSGGQAIYSATKGGVIALTKALAREMARHNININCVSPGPTNTPLFDEIGEDNQRTADALKKAIPLRRLAEPVDIAGAVAYFISDEAGYVTGQTLSVSGGLTMY